MKNRYPQIKLIILLATACLALVPAAFAVDPPPDGGYPGDNTAEGQDALFSLTTGFDNTGLGYNALYNSTTGFINTAIGSQALYANTTGTGNNATGFSAMMGNTTGSYNVADGQLALLGNTTGYLNTGVGQSALMANSTGGENTAVGSAALFYGQRGSNNTAVGYATFYNFFYAGSNNIAIGANAGNQVEHGNNNIEIGNTGSRTDSGVIRIGDQQTKTFIKGISGVTIAGGVGVVVSPAGQLGTITSSARYKEAIKPMDKASEALLALKPVTFRYKKELDPDAIPQFGLVAEQVAKVDPDLVARDEQGKPYTVRYEAVNAMLLNEFLKEHRKVEEQGNKLAKQDAEIAELRSALEKQAAQLQKVSERLASIPPVPRLVENR